jgi:putative ABC transport system permease protein
MFISAVVGIISVYISALIPSFFAGRISPLVAISSRNSITKEKIKKGRHRIIQSIFGFEGAMAAKNIKRNRKRYRITVFSIVISVVLFVVFKSFMDMTLTINDAPNESRDIQFTVYNTGNTDNSSKIDDNMVNSLRSLSLVDNVYKRYGYNSFDAVINKNNEIKEIQDMNNIYRKNTSNGSDKTDLYAYAQTYDSLSMEETKKYLEAGSIDIDKLKQENGVIVVNKNTIFDQNTKKKYVGPIADLKVGDEIELKQYKDDSDKSEAAKTSGKKVKVMGVVSSAPFDFGPQSGLMIIMTEDVAKNLTNNNNLYPDSLEIKIKNIRYWYLVIFRYTYNMI